MKPVFKRMSGLWQRYSRKIFYAAFLTGSGVLVSFRGGSIPYLLFYFALFLPIMALSYSFYVYCRFKIVQDVARTVVKAKEVPYRLKLANEDPIPFTSITLHYFSEMVTIKESENTKNLYLLSHEQLLVDTKMYCKYRGTYPVGVKSVSVTDFLGLFTITYPMKTQIRLTARPRILPLELLEKRLTEKDPKSELFSVSRRKELPDFELRQYRPGDPMKYIHWKNSAKAGELLVRKQMPEELFETAVIIDLAPVEGDVPGRLQTEDNIIEAALAFIHDYYMKQIPVRAVYMQERLVERAVTVQTGFEDFYDMCANLAFTSEVSVQNIWMEYGRRTQAAILITAHASSSLRQCIEESRLAGCEIELIDVGELTL